MMTQEFYFDWHWDLASSPHAIWPFAADTNRFNRDTGQPEIEMLENLKGVRRVRMKLPIKVEWQEEPFEWTYPYSFGIVRTYSSGPVVEMRVQVNLDRRPEGGTHLRYQTWIKARNVLAELLLPFVIGRIARNRFERTFRRYDRQASHGGPVVEAGRRGGLSAAGRARFQSLSGPLLRQGTDPTLMARLGEFLDQADELSLQRIRPYVLADRWNVDRRAVLEMFLRATRAGILDMSWDLLCPTCRGKTEGHTSLGNVQGRSHCETCQIDFTVNFDHNIEVVFRPNASVRPIESGTTFCVGSPQLQPHVVMSQQIRALRSLPVTVQLDAGRYVLRASQVPGSISLSADAGGPPDVEIRVTGFGWPREQQPVSLHPTLHLINATDDDQSFQLERTAWGDQASTAGDVTVLQVFRDLFANEVIRPGEEISIGSVTLLFTDLRDSTRLYRRIGDAPAFGRVREHFEILERSIAAQGGAIVKTMGDSVMATFRNPIDAVRAVWDAQTKIADRGEPMLWLKVGLHTGPCIVVNLNNQLDYFGSTVNVAARLPAFSQGGELVFTHEINDDPEVHQFLVENTKPGALSSFRGNLKGFDEPLAMWKLKI